MGDGRKESNTVSVDWVLGELFTMVERLCHEAHLSDEDISAILETQDREALEIITDTADEVLVKAQGLITEARLALRAQAGGDK